MLFASFAVLPSTPPARTFSELYQAYTVGKVLSDEEEQKMFLGMVRSISNGEELSRLALHIIPGGPLDQALLEKAQEFSWMTIREWQLLSNLSPSGSLLRAFVETKVNKP